MSYRAGNQRAYMDCMYERGWKYEKDAGPDRMDEMVTCRLPSAPKAEVMKARDCHNRYGTILTM